MAATVNIGGMNAFIDDDMIWHSDNTQLFETLHLAMKDYEVSGADPNPSLTAAEYIVGLFGGEVVSYDELDYDPSVVY